MIPAILRPIRLVIHSRLTLRQPARSFGRPSPLTSNSTFTQIKRWNTTATPPVVTEEAAVEEPNYEDAESSLEQAEEDPENQVLEELKNTHPPEAIDLLTRKFPLIHEFIAPSQSHLLTLTLQPHLNFSDVPKIDPEDKEAPHNPFTIKSILPYYGTRLPPGFHFAYFNGYTQESDLSPDGYISSQAPGGPWKRRMWAGGKLTFNPMPDKRNKGHDRGARRARPLDIGRRALCHEVVEDIQMKGEKGSDNEMMFVYIRRKLWAEGFIVKEPTKSPRLLDVPDPEEDEIRVLPDEECPLIEQRCLVYMKEKPGSTEVKQDDPTITITSPIPKHSSRAEKADFSHSMTPTSTLLFRYSALTFNAHKIHYDNDYTKNIEGHPKLIVHGPLTLTLLLETFRNHVLGLEKEWRICNFEYRNIAPLYVDEPITFYGRYLPNAPVPSKTKLDDPRDRLPPLYDKLDKLLKELKALGEKPKEQRVSEHEVIDDEALRDEKKDKRRQLKRLRKEIDDLEKFKPEEQRDVDYRVYELWAENSEGKIAVRGTAMIEDLPPKPELTPEQQWKRYQSQMARNKRILQKQMKQAQFEEIRKKRRERKLRLRNEQLEREKIRRQQKQEELRKRKEMIAAGLDPDADKKTPEKLLEPWEDEQEEERRYLEEREYEDEEEREEMKRRFEDDEEWEEEEEEEEEEGEEEDSDYDDDYENERRDNGRRK